MNTNKTLLPVLCGILLTINTQAQTWNYPDATFPSGTYLCDDTPWKLVFYDGFDGTSLSNQWHKFSSSWSGVPDSEDWDESHGIRNDNHLYKDENVIVDNGICRLLVKNEHYTWQCPSCTPAESITRNFTSGYIETPFHLNAPSTAPADENWYNAGKFEARIKFPTFSGAWSCFWLFNGYGGVDEIDIAEAYGDASNGWPYFGAMSNVAHVNNTLHAWGPKQNEPNPYNLPLNATNQNRYPDQTWWDFFTGNNFRIGDWHTYRCEWDTAVLKFYIDNDLKNTIWKYYRDVSYGYWLGNHYYYYHFLGGSGCNPDPGTWKVTYGFPYNNESRSNIRLDAWIDDSRTGDPNSVYELGEMQVDYVAAWQRHLDGAHQDLCNVPTPVVTGPGWVCNDATFSASPIVPGGYWTHSGPLSVSNSWVSGNTAYVTLHSTSQVPYQYGSVDYNYSGQEGCPSLQVGKSVSCPLSMPVSPVYVVQTEVQGYNGNIGQFRLFMPQERFSMEDAYNFEWDIHYATGSADCDEAQPYRASGRFISTPFYNMPENGDYCLQWQVKITGPDGDTTFREGIRNSQTATGQQRADTSLYYFDALVTDSAAYGKAVYDRVAQTFLPQNADTVAIRSMIERVRAEELWPYLITPDSERSISYSVPASRTTGNTRVFPNPASDLLHILPGSRFNDKEKLSLRIYDLPGRLQQSYKKSYLAGQALDIPIRSLKEGVYILELQQGACKEHYKFIRSLK